MRNSIRDNITKDEIIAEIRMELDADITHSLSVVVVEGIDDLTFFRGKLAQNVDIKESFSGKIGVKEIVEFFSDNRVLGVCDRDYDSAYENERIFFYDYSCLEMMMISNDSALSSFCHTYYRGDEQPNMVRIHVLEDLKWVSCYRKLSAQNAWAIRFTAINYSTSFDDHLRKIDYSIIMRQLKNSNPGFVDRDHVQLQQVSDLCRTINCVEDLLPITNGHDFLHYFQRLCCSYDLHCSSSSDDMFRGLVCAYRIEDFMLSNLYSTIKAYQTDIALSILSQ